ncbi:putative protein kinase [Trypanosoma conorhini]|uniref:Protein kinase domain-containing protein n=1 Tax=Trypanosoma conorhini TaxID=83891 RepID=A0A422Q9K4_9TRYP|nr:putative protein kinase [Trypanosoma conorhini]RNF26648.1 putative protein kinase [Trypanosoma conorhini]
MVNAKTTARRAGPAKQGNDGRKEKEEPDKKKPTPAVHATPAMGTHGTTAQKPRRPTVPKPQQPKKGPERPGASKVKKKDAGETMEAAKRTSQTQLRPSPAGGGGGGGGGVKEAVDPAHSTSAPVVEDLERGQVDAVMSSSCVKTPLQPQSLPQVRRVTAGSDGAAGQSGTAFFSSGRSAGGSVAGQGSEARRPLREKPDPAQKEGATAALSVQQQAVSAVDAVKRPSKKLAEGDSDDDDADEDEEEEDEEDEEEEDEEEDEEEEDEEDEEEEEEEEEDEEDEGSGSSRRQRVEEQITVKISREGDRNVKVIYVTRRTKFRDFAKDVRRRFAYAHLRDFDMYCIDAAGDHVDIDVPRDFKNLLAQFLRTQQRERQGGAVEGAAAAEALDSKPPQRFSARGTLRRSASLATRTSRPVELSPCADEGERSSSSVLRLYVRDSYRARKKEEEELRRLQVPLAQGQQGTRLVSPLPPAPIQQQQNSAQARQMMTSMGEDSATDFTSPGPTDFLSGGCSNPSVNLGSTGRFAQTIGFREDEEVQWSKMGVLGKGSFGTVYEGITSEGKIMAVKVVEIPVDEDAEEVASIQREINLMRSLKHKNIVAYYGCQTRELSSGARQLEIFLEHCHGGSLTHLRRKFERAKERFSISLVRTYAKQILEGLAYLHDMNVVHRDLKGDNVLISALGEAKLADFGCSKRIGTATMQQESTGEKGAGYQTMVGTPLFMAPEVLNGVGGYSKPADVWSVGCLVLEMLGRQPWAMRSNLNAFQIMYHISKSTEMPTGVPKNCPGNLYSFFTRCFERDSHERATAKELLGHDWITCADNRLQEVMDEASE